MIESTLLSVSLYCLLFVADGHHNRDGPLFVVVISQVRHAMIDLSLVMEYCDNRSQLQREETIQKKRKKQSAKDDDDELPHSKKLGSEDGFVFSTRRVTRSASKQQQQQHGEGEKQKKPVCSLDWREMTDEELKAYKKKAEESEGFDVGEVPEDVFMNIIIPCELDGPASELRPYDKMAKKALVAYNEENGTEYKFVKHVRVNRKGGATVSSYFITFQAKDKKAGSQNFQTAVGCYRDIIDVGFCRVEKKLQEPQVRGGPRKLKSSWTVGVKTSYCLNLGDGHTGYPLIDANVKELSTIGFMSNRGRQIVCSLFFRIWELTGLVPTMPIERLEQAQTYDSEGMYVSYWLPELAALPREKRNFPGHLYINNPVVPL